jgi:thiol-disulfide isomerase/thioredoxin
LKKWLSVQLANWKAHLGTVLVAVFAFVAVQWWQTREAPTGMAPDFSLPMVSTPDGTAAGRGLIAADQTVSLQEWRKAHPGNAVAIHIWSDWCPFCKAEESSISSVSQDWPVLTVAARSGDGQKVAKFMAQRGLDWPTALDPQGEVGRLLGMNMVPVWVVVSPDGQISSIAAGYTTEMGMRLRLWLAQNF